jgi:hypothetical protein
MMLFFLKQGKIPTQGKLDNDLGEFIKSKLNKTPEDDKEEVRQKFQRKEISSIFTITKDLDVKDKSYNLFVKYMTQTVITEGSRMKQRSKMIGRGLGRISVQRISMVFVVRAVVDGSLDLAARGTSFFI